ncbi:MAG: hypothetical protein DMF56_05865 [Acidobacteria bacterium]|nr:MAG: hypothetical protein DMF56_05865 [Acidobacteriota bacterium]
MTCPRESEILDALMTARWPEACEDELRAHAQSCALCADLVLVATAITNDVPEAHVPTSGVAWWRMQRRDREEAARAASRTITIVQASSILAAIAVVLTILGGVSAMSESWRNGIAHGLQLLNSLPQWGLPLLLTLALVLAAAPVALYFAVRD